MGGGWWFLATLPGREPPSDGMRALPFRCLTISVDCITGKDDGIRGGWKRVSCCKVTVQTHFLIAPPRVKHVNAGWDAFHYLVNSGFDLPRGTLRHTYQRHSAVSHIRLHSESVFLVSIQEPISPPPRVIVQDWSSQRVKRYSSPSPTWDSRSAVTVVCLLLSAQEETQVRIHTNNDQVNGSWLQIYLSAVISLTSGLFHQ